VERRIGERAGAREGRPDRAIGIVFWDFTGAGDGSYLLGLPLARRPEEEMRAMDIHQFHRMQSDATRLGELGRALGRIRDVVDVEHLRAAHIDRDLGWVEWPQSAPPEDRKAPRPSDEAPARTNAGST
jgi:hypothetical protein